MKRTENKGDGGPYTVSTQTADGSERRRGMGTAYSLHGAIETARLYLKEEPDTLYAFVIDRGGNEVKRLSVTRSLFKRASYRLKRAFRRKKRKHTARGARR